VGIEALNTLNGYAKDLGKINGASTIFIENVKKTLHNECVLEAYVLHPKAELLHVHVPPVTEL